MPLFNTPQLVVSIPDIEQFPGIHPWVMVGGCVGDWLVNNVGSKVGSVVGSIEGEWVALSITIMVEMKIRAVHFGDIASER